MIIKGTEPFFFSGNSTGCLLIHGFTGSPKEMRPLGEYLAERGYTVHGIRLPGHGTDIKDMDRVTWMDWSNSVLDGWNVLLNNTERIFLVGLSMGGVLALYQASFLPAAGVIGMSTIYQLPSDPRFSILPILSILTPYAEKSGSDWQDPDAAEGHFSYDHYPAKGVIQLKNLLQAMRSRLSEIKIPALLIHSKKDQTVIPENMEWIRQEIGTSPPDLKQLLLENSGHIVTRDKDKDLVFGSVGNFIQQIMSKNP
jgi:carboxylesterase